MVAVRASAESRAATPPRCGRTLYPAVCRPARPSVAPSRMASQAPRTISQIAEDEAPKKTDAITARGRVVLGR